MPSWLKLILYLGYVVLIVFSKFTLCFSILQLKKKDCSIHSLIKIAFIFFTEYSLSKENEALSCLMKCLGLQLVWRAEDKKLTVNKTMQNAYFPNIKKNECSSVPQSWKESFTIYRGIFVGGVKTVRVRRYSINPRIWEKFWLHYNAKEWLTRDNPILKQGLSRIEESCYWVY